MTSPTAQFPGFLGGDANNGLATQPGGPAKNGETETPPPVPDPPYEKAGEPAPVAASKESPSAPPRKDVAGDPLVKVPALPPLQPIKTAQDMQLRSLFGPEDVTEDEGTAATPTPTVTSPVANLNTLDTNKAWQNNDNNGNQSFTPFMIRVF